MRRGDTLVEVMFAVGIFGAVAIGAITLMNKGVNTSQTTLETTMARQEVDSQAEALRFIHGAYVAETNDVATDYSSVWDKVVSRVYESENKIKEEIPDFFTKENTGGQSCAELFKKRPAKSFVLNAHNLSLTDDTKLDGDILVSDSKLQLATTYPRLLYGKNTTTQNNLSDVTINNAGTEQEISSEYLYAAEGIWVTGVASDAGGNDDSGTFQHDFYDFYIQTCWDQAGEGESSTISSIIRLYNPKRVIHDAQPEAYQFALEYSANGGSGAPSTQIAKDVTTSFYDFAINPSGRPSYPHHKFLGWATSSTATRAQYSPGSTIRVDKRKTTIYAVWQRLYSFTLSYKANDSADARASNIPGSQSVVDIEPNSYTFTISSTEPTRPGYKFCGWAVSTNTSCGSSTIKKPGSNFNVSANTTLYAIWQKTYDYTLIYDANGGSGAPSSQTVRAVTTTSYTFTISGSSPTRTNYKFIGWALTSSATSAEYAPGDRISVSAPATTLYAVWRRVYTIRLSYDANGGSGAPAAETYGPSESSSHRFTISSTKPTRANYAFLGWSTSKTATSAQYSPGSTINLAANTTLYAVWRRYYVFYLAYDANGGSGAPATQNSGAQYSSSYKFTVSGTKPTRTGYNFLGWSTSKTATSASFYPGGDLTVTSEGTTTIYAVWQAQYRFTLSYDANGGSGAPSSQSSGYINSSSHTFTISSTRPTRANYDFLGWSTSSSATSASYQPGSTINIASNKTLYAVWRGKYNFTLSYDANGGSGAPSSQNSGYVTSSSYTFTLSTARPTRANYIFLGWSTSRTATSASYSPGGPINVSANTLIYAVWQPKNRFRLTYNANGGNNAPDQQDSGYVGSSTYTFTISTQKPYNYDYNYYGDASISFLGWSEDINATTPDYSPGGRITVNKDTTLFAVWENTMQKWDRCSALNRGQIITLRDTRDNHKYRIIKLDYYSNSCMMLDDLSFTGTTLTWQDSNVDSTTHLTYATSCSSSQIYSSNCIYNSGGHVYYNYTAATAGTISADTYSSRYNYNYREATESLCPRGWKLPSRNDITRIGYYHDSAYDTGTTGAYYFTSNRLALEGKSYFWSSSAYYSSGGNIRHAFMIYSGGYLSEARMSGGIGLSIRCIKE